MEKFSNSSRAISLVLAIAIVINAFAIGINVLSQSIVTAADGGEGGGYILRLHNRVGRVDGKRVEVVS